MRLQNCSINWGKSHNVVFYSLCVCVCFFSVFAWHAGFLSLIGQLLLLPRLRGIKEKEIKNTFFGVNYGL